MAHKILASCPRLPLTDQFVPVVNHFSEHPEVHWETPDLR